MSQLAVDKISEVTSKSFSLKRIGNGPIVLPNPENEWENLITTNPGAWYENGKVYLLYRAMGTDESYKISFGLAVSDDGVSFRRISNRPVFEASKDGFDAGGVEDPRIVKIGQWYYITYAARPFAPIPYWHRVKGPVIDSKEVVMPNDAPWRLRKNETASGLAMTKDFCTFIRAGRMTFANVDDRDVIIFPEKVNGKYVMLHRPTQWVGERFGCDKPGIWISLADDLLSWSKSDLLMAPEGKNEIKIGANCPPIKTDKGWLVLYHRVDSDIVYRASAMLLDLKDPRKILSKPDGYILEPEMTYEKEGVVSNVVFPCGNVVIDDTLFVYYGGADQYCCVASAKIDEVLDYLE